MNMDDEFFDDGHGSRAFEIHESLVAWLRVQCGNDDPRIVLAALGFEIGRIVGMAANTTEEINELLARITAIMRFQVMASKRAYVERAINDDQTH
jgi:hypothetical protein